MREALGLEDILGQGRAARMLRAELRAGAVPHAHLFLGPAGVGRVRMARRLAAVLLCGEGGQQSCGRCRSCRALRSGNHPDYHELGVPEGRQDLSITQIRYEDGGLQREVAHKPGLSGCHVGVIRDVERMSLEAANCFLKTLEEPPGECFFILIAAGLREVPETIVSRCRVVKFCGLGAEQVREQLAEEGADPERALWLALRSWGSPGLARSLREQGLEEFNRELVEKLLHYRPSANLQLSDWMRGEVSRAADSAAEKRLALQEMLECVALFFRDLAALGLDEGAELFNPCYREQLRSRGARLGRQEVLRCADRALEAIDEVAGNANRRLVLDDLFSTIPTVGETARQEGN